jgi:hypothetical protein
MAWQLGVSTAILDLRSFVRWLRSGTVLRKRLPDHFDSGTDFLPCMPQGHEIVLKCTGRFGSGPRPLTRGLIPVEPDTEGIKDSHFEPLSLSIPGRGFEINAHVAHRLATLGARERPAGSHPVRQIVARPASLESLTALEAGEVLLVPAGLVFPTHVALSRRSNGTAQQPAHAGGSRGTRAAVSRVAGPLQGLVRRDYPESSFSSGATNTTALD